MLTWLIDHTLTVYILLLCVALGLLVAWWQHRKPRLLVALGITAGLAGLVFLLSLVIETDRKRIERALQEMADGIEKHDLNMTFANIGKDCTTHFAGATWSRAVLHDKAELALRRGAVSSIRIFAFEVEKIDSPDAVVFFKAKPFGGWATGLEYCGCRATFRLEEGTHWRMTKLELFKPETTELLDPPI